MALLVTIIVGDVSECAVVRCVVGPVAAIAEFPLEWFSMSGSR